VVMALCAVLVAADGKRKPMVLPFVIVDAKGEAPDETASNTIITRSELAGSTSDLPEVLDEQPGLRTSRLGGLGSFSSMAIRGSTGDQVNVYLDGVPLNSGLGGAVDLSSVPLGPIERVVIYRGLAPLSFGASAMGGVVSVRTWAPEASRVEMRLGGGSFGTRFGRLFYAGGSGDWGGSVALDYQGSQGDFTFANDGGTAFEPTDDVESVRSNNRFDGGSLMLKGRVKVSEALTLDAVNLLNLKRRGIAGHGLHPTNAAHLTTMRNVAGLHLRGHRVAGTGLSFSVVPWLTWSQLSFKDPLGEVGVGTDDTLDQHLSPGLRLHGSLTMPLDDAMQWWLSPQVAVELRHEVFSPGSPSLDPESVISSTRTRLSLGGGLQFGLDPLDTEIIASLRHESSWSSLHIPENRDDLTREEPQNTAVQALTWRVAVAQRTIEDVKLTANVSHSVRMPSLFELFGNTGAVLGNPSLIPERGINADVGMVYRPSLASSTDTLALELYGFWNQTEDRIQFVRTSQGVSVAQNIDSAEVYGVEIGSYLDVLGHLRARASFTWMPALNRSQAPAYAGKQLPNRPRWKGYGRIEGYLPVDSLGGGEVGVHIELEGLGRNYDDLANLMAFPERVLVGAGGYVSFLNRSFRIRLDGRNLTNASVQDFIGHPLPGLSVMASLEWTPRLNEEPTQGAP
jgi:outer membrane receptor protein involved in Fe transport